VGLCAAFLGTLLGIAVIGILLINPSTKGIVVAAFLRVASERCSELLVSESYSNMVIRLLLINPRTLNIGVGLFKVLFPEHLSEFLVSESYSWEPHSPESY
jgi:hypothetical protein